MDPIDVQILLELMNDAQLPFSEISRRIGISRETVRKRFEKMMKEGSIKKLMVLVDGHKIGEQGAAFLMITCLRDANKEVVFQNLEATTDVCLVTQLIGDFDFFVWVRAKSLPQIGQVVNDIRGCEGIDQIETLLLPQTYFAFSLLPKITIKCDGMDLPKR
jgi:Lrp/AsnC family transcriptional regulator, regulator for asnA, asnC and gidA